MCLDSRLTLCDDIGKHLLLRVYCRKLSRSFNGPTLPNRKGSYWYRHSLGYLPYVFCGMPQLARVSEKCLIDRRKMS